MIKNLLKFSLSKFNLAITKKSTFDELLSRRSNLLHQLDIEFALVFRDSFGDQFMDLLSKSKSQIRQDLFVLSELNCKSGGFFVEFGATDGINLSNTYLLEKEFNFNGILAEPNPNQWKTIKEIRSAPLEVNCVWKKSGEKLEFVDAGDLSTIANFSSNDMHGKFRTGKKTFTTETISLTDLLKKYDAPKLIDYLSIDTEGSEFEILNAHDFDEFKFKIITVEHNFTKAREQIFELLTSKGYERKYVNLSLVDDWYVLSN